MTSIPLVTPAADETYEYCVVEVPAELEAHFEKGDTSLLFNGRLSDEATLVTQDATYAVRQVSQSNSLLLCALEDNPQADGVHLRMRQNATDLLELVRTTPRLDRLPSLFEADAYTGQATESDEARHYTPAEVRSVVQASESELEVGLREHHILVLDGYLRRVAPSFLQEILLSLLAHLDILACAPDRVPWEAMCDALTTRAHRHVVEAVLGDWFCAAPLSMPRPTHIPLARADIVQFLGLQLLQSHKRMPLLDFIAAWKSHVGTLAADVHLSLLQGHYLLYPPPATMATVSTHAAVSAEPQAHTLAAPIAIQSFSHTSLPLMPAQRCQELFTMREQWVREEITPFLAPIASRGNATVESMLLKYGRGVRAKWSKMHTQVLLHGALDQDPTRGTDECMLYQARVKYT